MPDTRLLRLRPPTAALTSAVRRAGDDLHVVGRAVSILSLAIFLHACATAPQRAASTPANLGELKTQLVDYYQSGRYERDLAAVADDAAKYLLAHAKDAVKPALVLDIDETALSNWEQMKADDFGYFTDGPCDRLPKGPCGALAWDATLRAPAIAPTLRLFKLARANGVAVFFITGRYEKEREVTEKNLARVGYEGWTHLYLRSEPMPSARFKSAQRAAIEAQGYTIIANVGDQPSDLAGGHAQKAFLLPNPYYRVP